MVIKNTEANEPDIEFLYRKYGAMVKRRCYSILRNDHSAADAVQETFVRLLVKKKIIKNQGLCSFLYRVATNICLNILRSSKGRFCADGTELIEKIASCSDSADIFHSNDLLDRIFQNEPVSSRVMAVMHWVDGLTLSETADQVGLSVSGVRKRLRLLQEKNQFLKEQIV